MARLKTYFLFAVILASTAFAGKTPAYAAESCGQVFTLPAPSREVVISQLADLILSVRKAQSGNARMGGSVDLSSFLYEKYRQRLNDLSSSYQVSKSEIENLLKLEVLKKQNLESESAAKEQAGRSQQSRDLKLVPLNFKHHDRRFDEKFRTVREDVFTEYVPEVGSFFWLSEKRGVNGDNIIGFGLNKYDIRTNEFSELRQNISAMTLLSTSGKALIITNGGKLEIIDLETGVASYSVRTQPERTRVLNAVLGDRDPTAKIAINEESGVVAVSELTRVYFFDLSSGAMISKYEHKAAFNAKVSAIHFLSEQQVLFNIGGELVKGDLQKNQFVVKEIFKGPAVYGLEVSMDKQTALMIDMTSMATINIDNLAVETLSPFAKTSTVSKVFKRVTNSYATLIHVGGESSNRAAVYLHDNIDGPSFDFGVSKMNNFAGTGVKTISIAKDASAAVIIGTQAKSAYIDIWYQD